MNKKANSTIVIFVILTILLIIAITTILVVGVKSNWWKNDISEDKNITYTNLFINGIDADTGEQKELNYIIGYQSNGTYKFISEGRTRIDDWTEIIVEENSIYEIWCYDSEKYYVGKVNYPMVLHQSDKALNRSFITCEAYPMGEIKVSHSGHISNGENNNILFSINSDNHAIKLSVCAGWTAGIINMYLANQMAVCDEGSWINWSVYNATTMKYTYYEDNYYRCGEERTERCESVNGNQCKVFSMDIPFRYKTLADSCWYTGNSLDNSTMDLQFIIKAENINQLDSITFYVFDEDRRYVLSEDRWVWMSEKDGINLGIPEDKIYDLNYEEF